MRIIFQVLLFVLLSLNCRAAIVPILRNTFTTNTFDVGVGGAIPYFDYPSGKFVVTPLAYTNGILFEPTLGFLHIFHTNTTGEVMLVLQEGGTAGPSIQAYSDRLVVANTNLSFDAVGPFLIKLRVDGNNVLQALSSGVQIESQSVDNTTNVALLVDTVNDWTNKSKLLQLKNHGTNQFYVAADGSLVVGRSTPTILGSPVAYPLVAYYDVASGDPKQVIFDITDYQNASVGTTFGEGTLIITTNSANWAIYSYTNSINSGIISAVSPTATFITAQVKAATRFDLRPTVNASGVPYFFDTDLVHTSADLFDVRNNGTNKFTVDFSGAITAGSTNKIKPGDIVTGASVVLTTTNYWEVTINGVVKKIALVQ